MIVLLQRVREASVSVEGKVVGQTGPGYLALVCAEAGDTDEKAVRAAEKTAKLRVFEDEEGRMNRSVLDAGGSVLAVSQFTLAADTRSGNRPGFSRAAPPAEGVPVLSLPPSLPHQGESSPARRRLGAFWRKRKKT